MTPAALSARIRHLDQLALGVARELQLEGPSDIFHWRERLEYGYALLKMRHGMESARVVLGKAHQRSDHSGR
jgi:hypothetical protein